MGSFPKARTANHALTVPLPLNRLPVPLPEQLRWHLKMANHWARASRAVGHLDNRFLHPLTHPLPSRFRQTSEQPRCKRGPGGILLLEQLEDRWLASFACGVLVLDPTAAGAFTMSGTAQVNSNATIVVDSSDPQALTAAGNSQVNAPAINVAGGVSSSGQSILNGQVNTGVLSTLDP